MAHAPTQAPTHAHDNRSQQLEQPCTRGEREFEYILLVRMSAMHKTHTWKRTLPCASGQDWGSHAGKWHVHNRSLAEVMGAEFPQCDLLRRLTAGMRDMSPPRLLAHRGVSYLHVMRQQVRKRKILGARRRAAFHNICGTASLHVCRGMRQLLSRGEVRVAAQCVREVLQVADHLPPGQADESWNPFLTRVQSKFGVCTEMYTVQGTATFRVSKDELPMMNFKGVRDTRVFMGMLQQTLGRAWDHGDEPLPVHVHMAIVAMILGRAVSVGPACLMIDVLEGVLPYDSLESSCMGEVHQSTPRANHAKTAKRLAGLTTPCRTPSVESISRSRTGRASSRSSRNTMPGGRLYAVRCKRVPGRPPSR